MYISSRSNVVSVCVLLEDLEELEVRLGSLDGNDVGVHLLEDVPDVVEVGVAEVRVDLSVVLYTSSRELERIDGPSEVGVPVCSSKRETLSNSRLIDLNSEDLCLLEVDDFVPKSKGELLALNLSGDIDTGERPVENGNWSSQHTLNGLLGLRLSVGRPLNSHSLGSGDIADDDRWADVSGSIRLNPSVLSEDETFELLSKVLNHIVSLGLSVNEDIESNSLLELDSVVDLGSDELVVLLSGDVTLGEFGTGLSDLLGLGERSDSGSGELGKGELLLLSSDTLAECTLSVVVVLLDGGKTVSDGSVGLLLELSSGSDRLLVGLKSLLDACIARERLGDGSDLGSLLGSEGEPVLDLGRELALIGKGDWGVEERRGGSYDDTVGTDSIDGLLSGSNSLLEVCLPDVPSRDETKRELELAVLYGGEDGIELVGSSVEIDVESLDGEVLDELEILGNSAEVGSQGDGETSTGKSLVGGLEGGGEALVLIKDKDRLIDLDALGASGSKLLQELGVDWDKAVEERQGLERSVGITSVLSEEKVGDRAKKDRSGLEASFFGLLVLLNWLGRRSEVELGRARKLRHDEMVVAVEPFLH